MKNIDEHIEKDREELHEALANDDQGKVRHLLKEMADLGEYKKNHPDEDRDPSPLEVFCDLNPDAPECKIYDD